MHMSVSCVHVCACVSENSKHIYADFAVLAGYSYERLDGSVRGEERNLAIKNFSTKDVFVFLLSTKAGGCPVFSPNALHFSAPICYRAVVLAGGGRKSRVKTQKENQLVVKLSMTLLLQPSSLNHLCGDEFIVYFALI